jgi:hypothetical protein
MKGIVFVNHTGAWEVEAKLQLFLLSAVSVGKWSNSHPGKIMPG